MWGRIAGARTTVSEATSNQATIDPPAVLYTSRRHQVGTFCATRKWAAAAIVLHGGTLPIGGTNHHDTARIRWRRQCTCVGSDVASALDDGEPQTPCGVNGPCFARSAGSDWSGSPRVICDVGSVFQGMLDRKGSAKVIGIQVPVGSKDFVVIDCSPRRHANQIVAAGCGNPRHCGAVVGSGPPRLVCVVLLVNHAISQGRMSQRDLRGSRFYSLLALLVLYGSRATEQCARRYLTIRSWKVRQAES